MNNAINPKHYTQFKITPLDAIEEWNLNFALGNVIKYIGRAGHKGEKTRGLKESTMVFE